MFINNYFCTTIWSEKKPEFVKSLNKASNKYISEAKKRNKDHIKKNGDFGISHHSTPLTLDNDFLDFRNLVNYGFKNLLKKVEDIIRHIYIGISMYQDFIF